MFSRRPNQRLGRGRVDAAIVAPPEPPEEDVPLAIGALYFTTNDVNPSVELGYGTWSLYGPGRAVVCVDTGDVDFDAAGKTAGAKTVTLGVDEMPAHGHVQDAHGHVQDSHGHNVTDPTHNHTQNSHNHTQDPHTHGMQEGQTDGAGTLMDRSNAASATTTTTDAATATNQAATATNVAATTGLTVNSATATNQTTVATNQSTGGGGAHNNLMPLITAFVWLRVA